MLKLFEAIAIFLGGHLLNEVQEKNPHAINSVDLLLSKSRIIIIFLIGAIAVPVLFVGGLILSVIGASHWIGDRETLNAFHFYVYFGVGLCTISVLLGAFGLSKKRFEIAPDKKPSPPPVIRPTEQIERIVVNVIKEFIKEPKNSKTAASPSRPLISNT